MTAKYQNGDEKLKWRSELIHLVSQNKINNNKNIDQVKVETIFFFEVLPPSLFLPTVLIFQFTENVFDVTPQTTFRPNVTLTKFPIVKLSNFILIKSIHQDPFNASLQIVWLIFHTFRLLLIVEPCNRTSSEVI